MMQDRMDSANMSSMLVKVARLLCRRVAEGTWGVYGMVLPVAQGANVKPAARNVASQRCAPVWLCILALVARLLRLPCLRQPPDNEPAKPSRTLSAVLVRFCSAGCRRRRCGAACTAHSWWSDALCGQHCAASRSHRSLPAAANVCCLDPSAAGIGCWAGRRHQCKTSRKAQAAAGSAVSAASTGTRGVVGCQERAGVATGRRSWGEEANLAAVS